MDAVENTPITSQENIIHRVKEIFNKYLDQKSLRRTSERFAILEEIYHIGHFDSQMLYDNMLKKNYRVSRATVYNTLDLLIECGLVIKHQFGEQMAIYEKAYHYKQHDHLICTDCKKIFEFCDPRLQRTKDMVSEMLDFEIKRHSLTFYGNCRKENCPHRQG